MTFDAGDIRAQATLDKKPFIRSITELRAEARKGIDIKVDADTKPGDAKVLAFKRSLAGIGSGTTTARVGADTAAADLKLKPLVDRLAEIRNRVSTAQVRLSGDVAAKRQLEDLNLSLKAIGMRVARPRVSLAGAEAAEIALDRLELRLARINASGGGGGFFSRLGALGSHAPRGLPLAIGAGLPLVGPLAGVAAGGLASFLTPTLAGGIGGGLFAKTASATYKTLGTDIKNLTTLQQRYNAATTNKARAAALAAEKKAWDALSPAEQKAANTMHSLDDTWTSFQKKLQPQSFRLLSTGADIADKGLKLLLPTTRAAGNTIDALAASADRALNQPYWHRFFGQFLPGEAHRALSTLGTDLGLGVTGISHLMEKFAPLGHDLEGLSTKWARRFEQWTQGQGPGRFVAWVEKEGPVAAHALSGLAHGVSGLVQGLAPIGQLELKALTPILNFIGDLGQDHPAVITAIGGALLTVGVGLKAIEAAKGATAVIAAIGALGSGGGFPIGGRGAGRTVGGTVARDAETVGEGAVGGTVVSRVLGRFGVSNITDALKLGARSAVGDALIIPLATQIASMGLHQSPINRSGIYNTGNLPQDFVKKFPVVSYLRSSLFARTNTRTASAAAQAGLIDNSANSGISLSGTVGSIVKTGDRHELASLVQGAKQFPQIAGALKPYLAQLTAGEAKTLRLIYATNHVRTATEQFATAEGRMATIAEQTGGKLTGQSSAAQANRAALRSAGAEVKSLSAGLTAAGVPLGQVKNATLGWAKNLRQNAIDLYGNKTKVDELLGSLHLLPKQIRTKIAADTAQARHDLQVLRQQITSLPDHTVRITTTTRGGSVTSGRARLASGGLVHGPGTGTSDSVPAWLSAGEFVVNAKATSRHRQLLHAINARGYAAGGQVFNPGGQHPSPNAPTGGSGSPGGGSHSSSGSSSSTASKGPSHLTVANAIASIINFSALTFASDLQGTAHQVRSGIGQMIDRLNSAVRNHYLAGDKKLVKALRQARAPLAQLADEEAAVTKSLSNAQQRLSTLRGNAASVRSGTVGSFLGLGDLTQASNTTSVGGLLSVEDQQVKVARAFHRNLAHLRKLGLSKDEYRTLEQQGPAAAGQTVALLATSSRGQIGRFNRNEATLRRLGASTGKSSADYLYSSRISDAQHDVADFRRDRREIIRHEKRTADAVEALLKGGLQDHVTHALLQDVRDSIRRSNTLLEHLSGAPGQAHTNHRAHVAGVNR